MFKKIITKLDSSKVCRPDCIAVVVLRNRELELSCTLVELFNMCLKESCFPYYWEAWLMVLVFKNVENFEERSSAKNFHRVSLFSVVNKVFEKLVNNTIVDHLEKCGLFLIFSVVFRVFWSTLDLLTVVSDRIARNFNRSGLLKLWLLIYLRLLTGFCMLVFFANLGLMEFQVRYLTLTLYLLLKLPPRKMEPWFVLWSFFLLRLLCISIILPYDHA